jgi:hypothetical protein
MCPARSALLSTAIAIEISCRPKPVKKIGLLIKLC